MPKIASFSPSVKVSPPRRRRRPVYRIRNWAAYNAGLKQRGSLTVWLTPDATGLKVYGEGEWNVRQHGGRKRRTWRKLHLGVQEATGEIVAQTLTPASVEDASQVVSLLDHVQTPVQTVSADGAYDKRKVFQAFATSKQGVPIGPLIPPGDGCLAD